jgi:hypothetical protein
VCFLDVIAGVEDLRVLGALDIEEADEAALEPCEGVVDEDEAPWHLDGKFEDGGATRGR